MLRIFLLGFLLLFTSCSISNPFVNKYRFTPQISVDSIIPNLNLSESISDMASKLCSYTSGRTIVVTDFVDLETLKPGKSGLLLSELLKSKLSEICNAKVVQVEFSKYFTIGQNGFRVLTRNIHELKEVKQPITIAIVGTYNLSQNRLYLFSHVLNIQTGVVYKMVDEEISYKVEGFTIFQ
ncbi:FlgO family outer membrane protein [Desulfurobacterium crinifex]